MPLIIELRQATGVRSVGGPVGQLRATWIAHNLYHPWQIFKSYPAIYVDQVGWYPEFLNLPYFN